MIKAEGKDDIPSSTLGNDNIISNNNNESVKRSKAMDWESEEVALFIRTLDNGAYAQFAGGFEQKGVDGEKLLSLKSQKQLGALVKDLGARYAIFEAVEDLKVKELIKLIL